MGRMTPLGRLLRPVSVEARLRLAFGAMFALIAVMIVTDRITILLLAGATLVLGCMYSMVWRTREAWLGGLLEVPDLASGIALQQLMCHTP